LKKLLIFGEINMTKQVNLEKLNGRILKISVICTAFFTTVALIIGFITSSQVILFDGVFNLVGIALTYLSIAAMRFMKKKDEWNYPFGKATFEPFIAIVQYGIILYLCLDNIVTAVNTILSGGQMVDVGIGMLYGVFSAVYNAFVFFYLKWLTKNHKSAISEVEIDQWKFSFLLGCGILIGFTLSLGLSLTEFYAYGAYVDPVLTVVITLLFGKTAIVSLKSCVRDLMQAAPERETWDVVKAKITGLKEKYQYEDRVLRIGKVGNKLVIEVDFIVDAQSNLNSIINQDAFRKQLIHELEELAFEKWITINFTAHKELSEHNYE
jgi:cation diffusion facilitator family transporter